ncbi:hypothetical protein WJ0W_003535 [Paenibacillus melissococcoides]|uniref:Uncharacterized protein n=1 Tax=Paenibacillus melissococcoides TaxID=2912268 RepID=A0ABN8U5B8_9BACL|nr:MULTISPECIES: hypothetical protein [Paenibacillus]GIO82260.1 hypothetical protein J6TS7_58700 [Paenibacillus dendritiformis]CAH8246300.1 hypothetical protein WJ0W_003535 [Paenibacillus melissococcoides]CAH8713556.1 hypothetical protein WDD9_003607 [Paenibacillus melissococcoides]CAH8714289.1 hypothetical protein HTL2_003910 [Paenibacillus melissococcoides]
MNQLTEQRVREILAEELQKKDSIEKITASIDRVENVLNVCLESLEEQVAKYSTNPDFNMTVLTTRVAEVAAQLLKLQAFRYMIISRHEHRGQ